MIDPDSIQNKAIDPDAVENRGRLRGLLRNQISAVVNGWIDPDHPVWEKVLRNAERLQDSHDDRVAHNASLLAIKMLDVAQKQAEQEDKANRLDAGEATENVRIVKYTIAKRGDTSG
jgi:uncharacterized protein with NRDE domain